LILNLNAKLGLYKSVDCDIFIAYKVIDIPREHPIYPRFLALILEPANKSEGFRPLWESTKIMRTLCEKAKVKYFRFHPFRYITAFILDDLGVATGIIQRILGHENRSTTESSLHSVGEAERKAMETVENVDIFSAPLPDNGDRPTNTHPEYWKRIVVRPD
jgi:integrase